MKTKPFFFVNRPALLAMACIFTLGFAACGGDDDEPSVDELLSEETTPVEFEYKDFYDYYQSAYCMFDYTSNRLVGSDTITSSRYTHNLRNGKHQLLWIDRLSKKDNPKGVHFNPQNKTVTSLNEYGWAPGGLAYSIMDLEVSQYLAPYLSAPLQVKCSEPVTCRLEIQPTDLSYAYIEYYGKFTGLRSVRSVSLTSEGFEYSDTEYYMDFAVGYGPEPGVTANSTSSAQMLCPLEGLDDIHLTAEMQDRNGNPVKTSALPSFSLCRGKTTVLTGPLFSGEIKDWKVEMY